MNVRLRIMEMTDLNSVIAIENSIYPDPWDAEMFFHEINQPNSYVLENVKNKSIIGYLCGFRVLDEFSIMNIAIACRYQNQGYGSMLLKSIVEELGKKGCRDFFLEVRVSNNPAISVYTKLGFYVIGRRRNHYRQPPEDALIMRLKYQTSDGQAPNKKISQVNEKI